MNNMITELRIIDKNNNIFNTQTEYIIPLYQRSFAWEDKELIQLIDDINDINSDSNYYIGTLIVSRQDNKFEVVDGQQRLTSFYLLLSCLDIDVKNTLTFACRDKSNYTLQNIKLLLCEDYTKLDMDRIDTGLYRGIKILTDALNENNIDKNNFINNLSKMIIYRIEVPENTDLNRYFEIMNTRGEQLEQHDILKAKLMNYLSSNRDKKIFATIWNACSDMDGYVQMHFINKNNKYREEIFGNKWEDIPSTAWKHYYDIMNFKINEEGDKIADIISNDYIDYEKNYFNDDTRVRFESIIGFSYFLLHTLKILIEIKGISHKNGHNIVIIDKLLDDKKLIYNFDRVIKYGIRNDSRIKDNPEKFAKEFILCLLRTRYLFDKYIIKREYTNDDSDGEWSLKSLYSSGQQTNKKAYYKNTRFIPSGDWDKKNEKANKKIIMLQSALRVSYTSPKVMHWITTLLLWLIEKDCKNIKMNINDFSNKIKDIARNAITQDFFKKCSDGIYAMGVKTPHIVFNYLDYLIWESDPNKYNDFDFEFRNSVEHWYPQHPSEGTFEVWEDGIDQFGNLCIIQRKVNSKFSNMSPEAKKSTFKEMIARGSLKLRLMSDLTEKRGNIDAVSRWKNTLCNIHENKMIEILKSDLGID